MFSYSRYLLNALVAGFLCLTVVDGVQAPTGKTLSFEDRVIAQRKIEQVYWRHRIWPKDNPGPKPTLDQVLPDAQIRAKVEDYLAKTDALDRFWSKPLTGGQLQAELDRMTSETKRPEVLRELFAALDDDPYVIAECLARPLLADRLAREWYARDARFHGAIKEKAAAALAAFSGDAARMKDLGGEYAETDWRLVADSPNALEPNPQRIERPVLELSAEEWQEQIRGLASTFGAKGDVRIQDIPVNRLSPLVEQDDRFIATAVLSTERDRMRTATVSWTKRTFDEWWEQEARAAVASHAGSDPEPVLPPAAGYSASRSPEFTCAEDTWTSTSTFGAPYRDSHTAVWTGTEMIVWGGEYSTNGNSWYLVNTGARYDPSTDSWAVTSTGADVPQYRYRHTAVWTGTEMVIWGGSDYLGHGRVTGGRYNPATDTWLGTSTGANAPVGRGSHTAVWTGSGMIVWGGYYYDDVSGHYVNSGGCYDPASNSWTATSAGANLPTGRAYHTAVWDGNQMILWGGYYYDTSSHYLNDGGHYDPVSDTWTATSVGANVPTARAYHTAVWDGNQMIVWGGRDAQFAFNTGGRYDPATPSWAPTSTGTNVTSSRYSHTAVWTGSQMIVWGGRYSSEYLNTGGRYLPSIDTWLPTSIGANVPSARYAHSAVWTDTEMIVWGGRTGLVPDFYTGGSYCACPNVRMWYFDGDGDGYGVSADSVRACEPPPGYAALAGDCNDANPNCTTDCTDADHDRFCVGHDCNDALPGCTTDCTDADGDGFCAPIDCNDGGPPPSIDGVSLRLSKGPGAGDVTLDWTGGQPTFDVFRATSPANVTNPGNRVYSCTERTWSDTPPPGGIHFYKVGSPCVIGNCAEICDGVDNDCDGTIDDAGSAALCGLPNGYAACVGGACVPSACDPNWWDLNGNPADGCEYHCVFQAGIDRPDAGFVDSNCDGIDGDLTRAVFVSTSGSDANAGTTRGLAVRTIAQGIAVAASTGRDQVLVEVGNYYGGQLTLQNGIGLYGNYQSGFAQRTATLDVTAYTAAAPTAVLATGLSATTELQYLKFASVGNAAPGGSSYGILATDSPGLVVRKCAIVAGLGGAGTNGTSPGGSGAAGSNGTAGQAGCEDGGGLCIPTCSRPQGGAGGASSCGATGGRGGNAAWSSYTGAAGSDGTGGALGGPGTPSGNGDWDTPFTYWGANGQAGAAGFDGYSGGGSYSASGYVPMDGAAGLTGRAGGSGGGGGGGGGGTTGCDSYGGGGGGGGAGGCGGVGGGGGGSAGGSFAIYLWNSNALVADSRIVTAGGGAGGSGGTGQLGGLGGVGGNCGGGKGNCYGGSGEQQDGSNGGRGGWGGQGGQGGYGGGGAGGPSVGIAAVGNSQPTVTGCTSDIGPSGAGGSSSGFPGPSCGNGVLEQGQRFTYTNSTALAIPDGTSTPPYVGPTVTSTIEVTDSIIIADLDVGVDITHTYISDLWFSVTAPGGQEVTLWNRHCGYLDNILKTFSDESSNPYPGSCYASDSPPLGGTPLSTLDGANALGVWTFKINDSYYTDTGTLNSWSLRFGHDGSVEQCDDGNRNDGDGCQANCTVTP